MAEEQVGRTQQDGARSSVELRQWLRNWVSETTETPVAEIRDDQPLEEFGLSSRDVVILSGELQRITGQNLDATVAYEHNSIGALVDYLASLGQPGSQDQAGAAVEASGKKTDGGQQAPGERDIAVVGMAGTFPGAPNLAEMWDLLIGYRDGIGEPPEGRWSEWSDNPEMVRRMEEAQLTGGYLPDLASFDVEFFGLSPLEAANMDPQQRILLKLTWEALEDALIPANSLRGSEVGVFIGTTNNDYANLIIADPKVAHPYALTGNSSSIIANRISYAFDFRGPSVAMDTACSSSLVAIHQAVSSLREGGSKVAIAGGVNLLANPFATIAFSETGVLSPTGKIHAFSEDADGIVRSDGAGVVVLKRLSDAVVDGDNVLGVIKGSAVNSDGRSNGITAPNPDAQAAVLRAAYADAGLDPATVDYVEAHGTGTILGDPIEARALGAVLGEGRPADAPTLLGSAKTNFGHTEAAAGVAGVIKVLLAMREGVLPPSLNYVGPNPHIDFDAQRIEVVEDPREWPEYSGRPVAGVSGFGFGGTNAHVVIAAPTEEELRAAGAISCAGSFSGAGSLSRAGVVNGSDLQDAAGQAETTDADLIDWQACEAPAALLPVSGFLPSRRRLAAGDLRDWLSAHPSADLLQVAGALAGRNHGRSRGIVRAASVEEALDGLGRLAEGKKGAAVFTADSPAVTGPVWVYSGFGSQHRKMGKELAEISPLFAERLAAIDEVVQRESGWSVLEKIMDDEQGFDLESAQVAITAVQIALTDLLRAAGLRPAAVVGQSLGEIGAAYGSGGLSMEDAMVVACHRSRLMGEGESLLVGDQAGAMAVIELGPEALEKFRAEHPEFAKVEPAVYAGPGMTTVGGPQGPVKALVEHLDGEGKFARMLDVKGAGHTSMLDPILGELYYEIGGINPRPIHTPLYSSVHRGEVYQPGEVVHDTDYFVHCTRHPVWFSDATGKQLDDGFRTFVEISAHPVALMPIMNNAFAHDAGDAKTLYALKRKEPAVETLLNLLAELYAQGGDVDLSRLYPRSFDVQLPGQHWVEQPHWTDAHPTGGGPQGLPGSRVDLPDGRVAFGTLADNVPSLEALAESMADELAPGHPVSAVRSHDVLPASGEITTIATQSLGGWSLQVYDAANSGQLLGEAFVSTLDAAPAPAAGAQQPAPKAAAQPAHKLPEVQEGEARWSPDSGVSVAQRLREIVSESMGYDVEDLPGELPLIDLGLDSLMGMRIKNRVEYEFDLPPLQVQQLRDGSVDTVIAMVEAQVASRGEEQSASDEASQRPAQGLAESQAEAASGEEEGEAAATDYTVNTGGVAPRDASERLVFATWAKINGKAAAGVTSPLPEISAETAGQIAERLAERSGAEVSAEQVSQAGDLAALADIVRSSLETEVEGNVRVLRARPEGSEKPSLFLFHPAGGSSVVYQPLTRRLPEDVPVYGIERLEGGLAERAEEYLDEIIELSAGRPIVLGGWSFGGALAYEVAFQLAKRAAAGEPSAEVERIVLLDTVQPAHPAPDTKEEMHARWDRYAEFVNKTYGLEMEVPHELLDMQGEDVMLAMFQEMLRSPEAQSLGLPAGVLEHQRASFVDNRILESLDFKAWAAVDAPVTLFRAERMHDGAIELEPAYRDIAPDGGWGEIVSDLEIVQLKGDHLAIVDEPEISKVGRRLAELIQDVPATDEAKKDEE